MSENSPQQASSEIEIDEGHYHEITDRVDMLKQICRVSLLEHAAAKGDSRVYAIVDGIDDVIADAYQKLGVIWADCET